MNITHQNIEQATAQVSVLSAGSAWVGIVADANEVLIFVATVIAIIAGAWNLYDKWKERKKDE